MTNVKRKRSYNSERRQMQAEATRAAILEAARSLFATKGWSATTIAAISKMAGVSTETVYSHFGNKRAIAQAMVVAATRGAEPDVPLMEQEGRRLVDEQTDPDGMIDAFALDLASVVRRVAPVLAVVRSAAETDIEMQQLYRELHAARRRNLTHFVQRLKAIGGLGNGLDVEAAATHVWSLGSPELYLLWTGTAGTSQDDYRIWLADALKRLLR